MAQRPITHLDIQVVGFSRMFALVGAQNASVSTNNPPAIELTVDWLTQFLKYMLANGYQRIESESTAEHERAEQVKESYQGILLSQTL